VKGLIYYLRTISERVKGMLDLSQVKKYNQVESFVKITQLGTFGDRIDLAGFFKHMSYLKFIPKYDTSNIVFMDDLFCLDLNLITIPLLNTSKVKTMNNMFYRCISLISVPLLDTSSLEQANRMFGSCISLRSIPKFNFSKVFDIGNIFDGCVNLQEIPDLDLRNVSGMRNAFQGTAIKEFKLKTPRVSDCYGAFCYCKHLEKVELDFTETSDAGRLFTGCDKLESVLITNSTGKAVMQKAFLGCKSLRSLIFLGIIPDISMVESPLTVDSINEMVFKASNNTNRSLDHATNRIRVRDEILNDNDLNKDLAERKGYRFVGNALGL